MAEVCLCTSHQAVIAWDDERHCSDLVEDFREEGMEGELLMGKEEEYERLMRICERRIAVIMLVMLMAKRVDMLL